mgnify:CR=1 FL=1
MKKLLLTLVIAVTALVASAQFSPAERQRWLGEMRNLKHDFIAKELSLTKDQEREFFPLYDKMEDEIAALNAQTREDEIRVAADRDATDLEMENTARTVFEQKRAEGQIEMTYFEKYKTILTPKQLLQLKNAERKFTQQLVNRHRRVKRGGENK